MGSNRASLRYYLSDFRLDTYLWMQVEYCVVFTCHANEISHQHTKHLWSHIGYTHFHLRL